jgi:hypothetical protein
MILFFLGLCTGALLVYALLIWYHIRVNKIIKTRERTIAKHAYLSAWKDSLFHALGEYDPEAYVEKRALEYFEDFQKFYFKTEMKQ